MARMCRVLIPVVAAGLLVSACTVNKTDRPALTGPSELGLSLNLTANPDTVAQNASQSQVMIVARDQNGQAVKGLPLHLSMSTAIGTLSASDVTTGGDGRAAVLYTAPAFPTDDKEHVLTISATPVSTDYAQSAPRSVDIHLVLPDVITPRPVANFVVTPASPGVNSPVSFDGTSSTSANGAIVGWSWDFGDGPVLDSVGTRGPSPGTGATPQHVYRADGTYTVKLWVTDSTGRECASPATSVVTVAPAQAPTAAFVFSPDAPVVSQTIFFNGALSTAATGRTIMDYAWDFGNGRSQHGVSVTTAYAAVGRYTVVLTVTDDIGLTSSTTKQVEVK